jgi:hypothetical protein
MDSVIRAHLTSWSRAARRWRGTLHCAWVLIWSWHVVLLGIASPATLVMGSGRHVATMSLGRVAMLNVLIAIGTVGRVCWALLGDRGIYWIRIRRDSTRIV